MEHFNKKRRKSPREATHPNEGYGGMEPPPLKGILKNKNEQSPFVRSYTNTDNPENYLEYSDLYETYSEKVSVYNPKAKSVSQYAYEENKNYKYRTTMEDFHKIVDRFNKDPNKGYFSLFDGHGGTEVVEYVRDRLLTLFTGYYKDNHNLPKIFKKSFEVLDHELKRFKNIENVGSTATVVFLSKETDVMMGTKRVAYCANVGDTRCVVLNSSGCKRLSFDHKCNDNTEVERIKKAGGTISQERVFGKLALTRAFGDYSMKNYGVIATPTVNKITLNDGDKFIVICSDGVWDVMDEEDLFYYAAQYDDAKEFAETIIEESMKNGSTDNISCIVIKL